MADRRQGGSPTSEQLLEEAKRYFGESYRDLLLTKTRGN